jgi:hypothetical protein
LGKGSSFFSSLFYTRFVIQALFFSFHGGHFVYTPGGKMKILELFKGRPGPLQVPAWQKAQAIVTSREEEAAEQARLLFQNTEEVAKQRKLLSDLRSRKQAAEDRLSHYSGENKKVEQQLLDLEQDFLDLL